MRWQIHSSLCLGKLWTTVTHLCQRHSRGRCFSLLCPHQDDACTRRNQLWIKGADKCLWCLLLICSLAPTYTTIITRAPSWFSASYHIYSSNSTLLPHLKKLTRSVCLKVAMCKPCVYSFLYSKGKKCDFWADFWADFCDKAGAYEYLFWMLQFIRSCIYRRMVGQIQPSNCWHRIFGFTTY